jgi:DNA-binding MarR family transcriptional regulator
MDNFRVEYTCKYAGNGMTKHEEFVRRMASLGNLFLLITLPELRRQGLTPLALYALQRVVDEGSFSEYWLRRETGLADYETSRACALLAKSELVKIARSDGDGRIRVLTPTTRGRRLLAKVISAAAERLMDGIPPAGRSRRMDEATELLRRASDKLLGPFQLSFFDPDLVQSPGLNPPPLGGELQHLC